MPASDRTLIARPDDTMSKEDLEKGQEMLSLVIQKMTTCDPNNPPTLNELLASMNVNIDYYYRMLSTAEKRSSILMKRSINEQFINNYNPVILRAIRANMDIKYVCNPWACIAYMTSYMCKPERHMSELMKKAAKETTTGNVRHVY